jgi:hypothetical protein
MYELKPKPSTNSDPIPKDPAELPILNPKSS